MSNLEQKASDYANSQFNPKIHSQNVPNFHCTDLHEAFAVGYGVCKREYEEKLRWIPVEEKDAPTEIVQMKLENGENRFGYFQERFKTTSNVNGFDFIKVTHYRTLYFYNAT